MHAVVEELVRLVDQYHWHQDFQDAIDLAQTQNVPAIARVRTVSDYYSYIDDLVTWAPRETGRRVEALNDDVYDRIVEFYFFLDQPPVRRLQSPMLPGSVPEALTPLSQWIVDYARAWESYLDTTDSAKEVKTFKDDPMFNWDEYMSSPANDLPEDDWRACRTFNQCLARDTKPGTRALVTPSDDSVIVSRADCTFVGWSQIGQNQKILLEGTNQSGAVNAKAKPGWTWWSGSGSSAARLSTTGHADRRR